MKKEPTIEGISKNKAINTKAAFSNNNQVYLKKNEKNMDELEDWYPINFQWIPVIELNKKL